MLLPEKNLTGNAIKHRGFAFKLKRGNDEP